MGNRQEDVTSEVNVGNVLDGQELRKPHIIIWALSFLNNLVDGYDAQLMAFTAPAITQNWHTQAAAFAVVFVGATIGIGLGNFISGPIADRMGRKNAIIVATIFYSISTLLTPFATTVYQMAVLRFIAGLGLGSVTPNAFAIMSEYAPARHRATLIGTMFVGGPLGGVIAGLVTSRIIPEFGWHGAFYFGGSLPILLLPFMIFALPESVRFLVARGADKQRVANHLNRIVGRKEYTGGEIFTLLAQPKKAFFIRQLFADGRAMSTVLISLIYVTNLLTLFFLGNWLPLLLRRAHIPNEHLLTISSLFYLGGVFGGIILARIVDQFGTYRILIPTFVMTALVSAIIGYTTTNYLALEVTIFFSGFCVIGGQTAVHPVTAAIFPTAIRSSGMAWALGVGRLGAIVGSAAGGVLLGLGFTTPHLFMLLLIPTGLATLALAALARLRKGIPDAA